MDTRPYEKPKCRYGSKCYRANPDHKQKYSHPPASETQEGSEIVIKNKLSIRENGKVTTKSSKITIKQDKKADDVVRLPPDVLVSAVVGKSFANAAVIGKQTGVRSVLVGTTGNQKINLFGASKQVDKAKDCWHKLIAVAPRQRNVEKIYPKTAAIVEFFPAPEGIRILKQYQDPQVLTVVGNGGEDREQTEFTTTVAKQLQKLTNYVGYIKLHAKFGKNVWYLVPDSLLGKRPASEVFNAIRQLPVKSFFSMGIADEKLLTDVLEFRKAKESFNLKILVNQGGLFESILVTVLIKDGVLRFAKAQMFEEKHITDQICLDKDVDIRLSLENTKLVTSESPLHPVVLQFAQALQIKKDRSGENTIALPTTMPHVQVYRIQHKKRISYIYEEAFNIDVINVRIFESEDKLLASDYKPPLDVPFEITPTEVEVSSQKWKRAFKYNKLDQSLHPAWTVEHVMAGFPQFIKVVHEVAALLANAAKKSV